VMKWRMIWVSRFLLFFSACMGVDFRARSK
jgi:hypothetical protein